jgi:hypothetical protein
VSRPALPWRATDVTARGGVRGHGDPGLRVRHDPVSGLVAVYDVARREAIVWFPDAREIPWSERSSPLREVAGWALAGPRLPLVHAAAVGGREGGVLLSGPSGSGKSVTALAALAAGLRYAGDDHVLVSLDPAPVAHSLSSMARVREHDLQRFPELGSALVGRVGAPYAPKGVLEARRIGPGAVVPRLDLSGVVIPQVTNGHRPRLRSISGAEALRQVAPSTIFMLSQEPRAVMAATGELVRRLPSYALELTGDPARAAQELEELCGGP